MHFYRVSERDRRYRLYLVSTRLDGNKHLYSFRDFIFSPAWVTIIGLLLTCNDTYAAAVAATVRLMSVCVFHGL